MRKFFKFPQINIALTAIFGVIPFILYAVERAIGILPSREEWWELGANHGPWSLQMDEGGRGIESWFVGTPMIILLLITIGIFFAEQPKRISFQKGMSLLGAQLLIIMLQLAVLGWTID